LTRFHWLDEQIPPSQDVAAALLKCPAIEDVEIFSNDGWDSDTVIDPGAYGVRLSIHPYLTLLN